MTKGGHSLDSPPDKTKFDQASELKARLLETGISLNKDYTKIGHDL